MIKKTIIAVLIAALGAFPLAGIALAAGGGDRQENNNPRVHYGGKVTQVDLAGGEFSITNRRQEIHTFKVNEATSFHSRDGSLQSFDDLVPDMLVMVLSAGSEQGNLVAKRVILIQPAWLGGQGARGIVLSVGESSFTIENMAGEQMTFSVDDETRFISRGVVVQSLDDLREGMRVGVKYLEQEDGSLLAKAVLAGHPRRGRGPTGGHPGGPAAPPPAVRP